MELKIICPYCGSSQKFQDNAESVVCQFCGSIITDIAVDIIKQHKGRNIAREPSNPQVPNQRQLPFPSQNVAAFPVNPSSQRLRVNNQPIKPQTPNLAANSGTIMPETGIPGKDPFQLNTERGFPQKHQIQTKLRFPQIGQELKIPSNSKAFHFGRNYIIPLVPPDKFDVEWLNSISRIRTQNNRVIHQHFIIHNQNNKYYIEDSQSRWGTWLNRQQIKGKGKFLLKSGDKIELMLSKPNVKKVFPFLIIFIAP